MLRTALTGNDAAKQKFTVNVGGYQSGLYIVTLYGADALHHVKLIVK